MKNTFNQNLIVSYSYSKLPKWLLCNEIICSTNIRFEQTAYGCYSVNCAEYIHAFTVYVIYFVFVVICIYMFGLMIYLNCNFMTAGLRKAKKYDWKDSNMALFGSDTEKNVKSKYY